MGQDELVPLWLAGTGANLAPGAMVIRIVIITRIPADAEDPTTMPADSEQLGGGVVPVDTHLSAMT